MPGYNVLESSEKAQDILRPSLRDFCIHAIEELHDEMPELSDRHICLAILNAMANGIVNFAQANDVIPEDRRVIIHHNIKTILCQEIDRHRNAFAEGN